jgi:hypothetical protein
VNHYQIRVIHDSIVRAEAARLVSAKPCTLRSSYGVS